MPATPTIEPLSFSAGDTVTWLKTVSDYPPADGWTLTYKLRSSTVVYTVTCATSGTDYLATITAAASAAYVAGVYSWVAYVTRTVDAVLQQHTVGSGNVTVLPNLSVSGLAEPRTDARIIYDDLIASYKTFIAGGQANIIEKSIAGRTIRFDKATDYILQIEHWRIIVQREEDTAKVAQGHGNPRRVGTRFRRL